MDVETRIIDNKKGKGLFAKRAFKAGSIIFEEDPLVSCQFAWNAAYQYKACDHCLRPLESAEENARRLTGKPDLELPFAECCTTDKSKFTCCSFCGAQYCCLECQTLAYEQYHRTVCRQSAEPNAYHPLERLNEAWKHIHYPPETNTIMLIVRLLARIVQAENRDQAIEQTLQFCHRTINEDAELAHKLLGDKFASQINVLHGLLLEAMPHEGVEQFLSAAGFQGLLALIGTNGQGVGTSAISQWVTKCSDLSMAAEERDTLDKFIDTLYEDMDTHSGNFFNNEGVALYALQSAANHSCEPNAEPTYPRNSHRLVLVALKDIAEGDEITISYLDECSLERSRHWRRKQLMENYLFGCECRKCERQIADPDVTSEEEDEEEEEEDMSD